MVFEKKQLSKVLAIALMVACAVAFMPLLNGQVFAAKKPGKAKITSLEQADTANDDGTYAVTVAYKAKKAKKYQVSYTDGTEAKTMKTKKKSVSFNGTVDSTYTVKVRGIKGKKKGKWSAAQEIKVEKKTPGPTGKMEVTAVAQSGVKQLKVTFGTAVADPSALKFTVTRDGKEITATAKADPDDPNSVLLDLDSTIVKDAKYDVAVATADGTPVPTAAGAQTEVQGEEGAVTSIEVNPDLVKTKDALEAGETTYTATTSFVIKNQFGEDVTAANYSDMNITCTLGNVGELNAKGEIEVTGIQPTLAIPGTKGTIVAVYKKTGVTTSQEVTVGAASKITEIAVKGIYNKKGEEAALIAKTALNGEYIAFEMKDQYGRAMTAPTAAAKLTPTMIAGLTNLANVTATDITTKTIDDVQYYAVPLKVQAEKALAAGDASVIIVANETGAKAEYAFKVSDENVIANLTITPPAQVIGGKNAVFTVEATNAAGEAITDYALLKDGIKLPGNNGVDPQTGKWGWKKLKDGSGELSLDAKAVDVDTLASAIFQTVDTYKTSYFTFTILTGVGVPYEITDITVNDVESTNSVVVLDTLKIADVYGDAVSPAAAAEKGYTVKISQPDYTDNSKALVLYNGDPIEDKSKTIALSDIDKVSVVYNDYETVGEGTQAHQVPVEGSAIAKVNAVLVKDDKPVLTSEITKPISVAWTSPETVYDSYVVKLTSDGVVGADGEKAEDIETIYAGTAKGEADGYAYIDTPKVKQFDIKVYGLMDGSTREYPVSLSNCKLQSAAGFIADDKYKIGTDTKSAVAEAGVTEDTISVLIPSKGSAPVATKTVKFASDKPVATFIAGYEKAEGTYMSALTANALDAAAVKTAIADKIKDQYGVAYTDQKVPSVVFVSAIDTQGNYVDAKNGETVNYKVDYDNTEYFKFTAVNTGITFKTINVTATYGAINADLALTVSTGTNTGGDNTGGDNTGGDNTGGDNTGGGN